jgi:hypothetical protein
MSGPHFLYNFTAPRLGVELSVIEDVSSIMYSWNALKIALCVCEPPLDRSGPTLAPQRPAEGCVTRLAFSDASLTSLMCDVARLSRRLMLRGPAAVPDFYTEWPLSPPALVFCKKCKHFLLRHTSGDRFCRANRPVTLYIRALQGR